MEGSGLNGSQARHLFKVHDDNRRSFPLVKLALGVILSWVLKENLWTEGGSK